MYFKTIFIIRKIATKWLSLCALTLFDWTKFRPFELRNETIINKWYKKKYEHTNQRTKWITWMAFWTSYLSGYDNQKWMYIKYCVCVLRRFRLHTILYTALTAGSTMSIQLLLYQNHSSDFKCKHFGCEQFSIFFSSSSSPFSLILPSSCILIHFFLLSLSLPPSL